MKFKNDALRSVFEGKACLIYRIGITRNVPTVVFMDKVCLRHSKEYLEHRNGMNGNDEITTISVCGKAYFEAELQ